MANYLILQKEAAPDNIQVCTVQSEMMSFFNGVYLITWQQPH